MECATVNAVTTGISARKRRNGITRQNRNSRWSVPSRICRNPSFDESQGGLIPARIQLNDAGIADEFEGPYRAAGRQEAQHGDTFSAPAGPIGVDGKAGLVRLDRVHQHGVEQHLVPHYAGGIMSLGPRTCASASS